jgi:hypothetical protein
MTLAVKRCVPVGLKEHKIATTARYEVTKGQAGLANIFESADRNCLQFSKKFFRVRRGNLKNKIRSWILKQCVS